MHVFRDGSSHLHCGQYTGLHPAGTSSTDHRLVFDATGSVTNSPSQVLALLYLAMPLEPWDHVLQRHCRWEPLLYEPCASAWVLSQPAS
mmetsp:Transcript_2113/g.3591  ORF Transcript_2113/g.3591 Transcript_2113/m.3591 type:complete len:89 (+) Transcript_2113:85-351(+)